MTRPVYLRVLTDVLATVVCVVGAVSVFANLQTLARPVVVLIGLVLGTGWSLAGWIKLPSDIAYTSTVVLGVGVAVPIIASVVMVEGRWWHPVGAAAGLLCAAAALNLLLSVRDVRRAAAE